MLRVWMVRTSLLLITGAGFFSSAIMLSYLVVLRKGAQSVTADRDTRHSDGSGTYKGVRQQDITEHL